MEDILYELGLHEYAEVLRQQNMNFTHFRNILKSSGNTQQMRQLICQKCGLKQEQILAILEKVKEVSEK